MVTVASVLRYRKLIVTGNILMMICTGFLYTWSVFVTPLETEMEWTRAQTSMAYTFATIFNVLGSLVAAFLNKWLNRKKIVRLAGFTTCLGFILASYASQPWHLYVYYGILMSASLGMVYNSIIVTIVSWYPEKSGMISGILLMCFGFAGILFSSAANTVIATFGWRGTFVLFGVLFFLLFEAFAFCVKGPSPKETAVLPATLQINQQTTNRNVSSLNMIKTLPFWLFAFWVIMIAAVGLTLSSYASPIAQSMNISSSIAAFYAGLVSVGSGSGRLFSGMIYDRRGLNAVLFSSLIAICGGLLLFLSYNRQLSVLLGISFFLIGMGFGGSPVCTTGFVKTTYGEVNYGINLSIATLPVLVASYVGPYLAGIIYQMAGYHLVCIAIIVYAMISLLFAVLLQKVTAESRSN